MNTSQPRFGYTLPVFACAAAIAALHCLQKKQYLETVSVNLIQPAKWVEIPVEQVAPLHDTMALGITRSDPGDNLDLTKNTPIWAMVEWGVHQKESIVIKGGEGVGKQGQNAAIYSYAQQVLQENLQSLLQPEEKITITIILPEGRKLAERTSNAAFGVVEGLSLLGTTGIAQPLSAPGQFSAYQEELELKAKEYDSLVFCIGENGLDLAQKMGIKPERLLKTANWMGSLLVTAATHNVQNILLFGYHGKLIKLAGGIFHTSSHLADGRLETLTAYCAKVGLPTPQLQQIYTCSTTESALQILRKWDAEEETQWVNQVYSAIASAIDERSQRYIRKHSEKDVCIGSILFDRNRKIIVKSPNGTNLLDKMC